MCEVDVSRRGWVWTNQQAKAVLVQQKDAAIGTLSPHTRVSLCVWRRGTHNRRALLSGIAQMRYGLHEFVSEGAFKDLSGRSNSVGL
jgi:hypothetical protein